MTKQQRIGLAWLIISMAVLNTIPPIPLLIISFAVMAIAGMLLLIWDNEEK